MLNFLSRPRNFLISVGVLVILIAIPLTVLAVKQQRDLRTQAKQSKETTTETLDQSYVPNQLLIQFKAGVTSTDKNNLIKAYGLKKAAQAKGTEKYDVQLATVNPKKAKQIIGALSRNRRVEKVDYVQVPDSGDKPALPANVKTKSGSFPVKEVYAAYTCPNLGQDGTPLRESLTTTEGTTICMYTLQMKAQTVYDLFKRNGLNMGVGKTLVSVDVYDSGGTAAALGLGFVDGKWIPVASIRLTTANLGRHPNDSVGHEFGHVFAHHYMWTVWNGSWDSYLKARGLYGDPRLDSSYSWREGEIFAEDYRQLLASFEAWSELPDQLNKEIPLASEVPGLQEFLCTTFQGKTSNDWFRCNTGSDTTPPSVTITSPAAGATVKGLVDVTLSATDNVGVTKTELYVDGSLYGTDLASPFVFSWGSTKVANGSHTLSAKAYDAAGNTASSASVTVTVSNTSTDTQPPVVSITSPTDGQTVSGTITISASATDNVGVTKAALYVDNNLKGTDTSSPYSFSLDTRTLSNGNHNFEVRAYDAAGNVGYSGVVTVNVNNNTADTSPPTVTITFPTDGSTLSSKGPTKITVSATDNVGVTKVEVYIDGTLKNTRTSTPYTYNWNPRKYLSGTHLITAKAYDAVGNSAVSSITVVKQ